MSEADIEVVQQPRARVLTEADMLAIARMIQDQHSCRFDNMTSEDMDFIKDLLLIYKETRSEVIKWIVKGVVYGMLILIAISAWFKWGHK